VPEKEVGEEIPGGGTALLKKKGKVPLSRPGTRICSLITQISCYKLETTGKGKSKKWNALRKNSARKFTASLGKTRRDQTFYRPTIILREKDKGPGEEDSPKQRRISQEEARLGIQKGSKAHQRTRDQKVKRIGNETGFRQGGDKSVVGPKRIKKRFQAGNLPSGSEEEALPHDGGRRAYLT